MNQKTNKQTALVPSKSLPEKATLILRYKSPLLNVKSLTDLTNRPREERLSVIEREFPGGALTIATMQMQRIAKIFKGQISGEEIVLATELILAKYHDLTVADIQYFVQDIASEKVFGELNVNKIVVAFTEFYVRRENACADAREKAHYDRKHEQKFIDMKKVYTDMRTRFQKTKKKAKEKAKRVIKPDTFNAQDFEKQ